MSWYDKINDNLHDIANKAGLTPEKLKSVTDTLNKYGVEVTGVASAEYQVDKQIADIENTIQRHPDGIISIPDHAKALQVTAEQHGIEVGKIRESLAHAGTQLSNAADSVAAQVFHKDETH